MKTMAIWGEQKGMSRSSDKSRGRGQNPNSKKNLKPFEPGQSGNPAGTKPGTIHLATILKRKLAENNGEGAEELIDAMLENAKKGLSTPLNIDFDRVDGPVVQKHEFGPITVEVIKFGDAENKDTE